MIKAILMDFNGVIIDDEPIQMQAYKDVLKDKGIDLTEEKYYACLGMNDKVFLKTIFERDGKELSEDEIPSLVEAKTSNWRSQIEKRIPLFDGIEDFIKRMENEFILGLVSMARRPEIEFVLKETGLGKSFSTIISSENVTTTKPDPECYRKGFNSIDRVRTLRGKSPLTRKQCVVIEDSPQGITAGRLAGLRTLGVTNTVEDKKLRDAGADSVTSSLNDWAPESFNGVFV